MFNRGDARCAINQRGAKRGLAHVLGARTHLRRHRQISAPEDDAGIGGARSHRHQHFLSGMQAHAGSADAVTQRTLTNHVSTVTQASAGAPTGAPRQTQGELRFSIGLTPQKCRDIQ